MQKRRVYFDYAATSPVDKQVLLAMQPYFSEKFGNPGSLHFFGQEAIAELDASRETFARILKCEFGNVIFTGSATEANNLAIFGGVERFRKNNPKIKPRVIVSEIEHDSVRETCRVLAERDLAEVIFIPPKGDGGVEVGKIMEKVNKRTAIVSLMFVNNETGVIQPVGWLGKQLAEYRKKTESEYPLLHADCAQAFQYFNHIPERTGADTISLSGHKIMGPKGVGVLYVKNREFLSPFVLGGSQEYGLRSGTENVPLVVGFSEAAKICESVRNNELKRMEKIKERFLNGLRKIVPDAEDNFKGSERVPNILSIYFPEMSGEALVAAFDKLGIAASNGSACSARSAKISETLRSCGFSDSRIKSTLRFSFGRLTSEKEIDEALSRMEKLKKAPIV